MWRELWQKWTIDKPAALGDWLWDVFVVQLAALLDKLTLRKVIALIPLVILIVAIYILMNIACIGYFARRRTGFNVLTHLIIPVLGVVAFVPAWLSAAGLPVFSFISSLTPPLSYMGPGVAGWMVIGVIYLIYLYSHDRQRVVEVGLVHLDLEEEHAE